MSRLRSTATRAARSAAVPALVFVAVWAFRFLSMGAIENDHFVALARAHQILYGDLPVRDFADPGQPLTYLTSAAAAWLFGPTLLTDAATAITLLALAAAVTFALAYRASDSLLIAAVAVAVEVAAAPRLYNAGKVLLPLVAVWLGWRYVNAASIGRLASLAAWTALASLWRHDYAVYIAAPTIGLLFLVHDRQRAIRDSTVYAALCLVCLLPWLVYVQWAGGLFDYAASALRFAATEAERTVGWPGEPDRLVVFLVILAIPLAAVALARRVGGGLSFAHIAYIAAMALIVDVVMLRDVIANRMPDVIGLTVVLAAWIAGRLASKTLLRVTAAGALVLVAAFVGYRLASQGFGLPTPGAVVRRFVTVSTALRTAAPTVVPSHERLALIRFITSCTPERSRVLVSGFGPEIPVLAHRPFAGGLPTWLPGYYTHSRDVERAMTQLSRESISIAVMLEGSAAFADAWPQVAADLRARNLVERTWRLDGSDVVVWIPVDVGERSPDTPPRCDP